MELKLLIHRDAISNIDIPSRNSQMDWSNSPSSDTILAYGGVAERTMAAVLKTANLQGFMGSNPIPSAKLQIRIWLNKARLRANSPHGLSVWTTIYLRLILSYSFLRSSVPSSHSKNMNCWSVGCSILANA